MNVNVREVLIKNKLQLMESRIGNTDRGYWHASLIDENSYPVSGGWGSSKDLARTIAISEWFERNFVFELRKGSQVEKEKWDLIDFNSACGFAAGFDEPNTRLRSVQEASERWVMSLWIDSQYFIPERAQEEIVPSLSEESQYLVSFFDKVRFFEKRVIVDCNDILIEVNVVQTMGYKGNGIFPGSSASDRGNGVWEHALLESARHLMALRNNPNRGDVFPENRLRFFAENKDLADMQIRSAFKKDWPVGKLRMHRFEELKGFPGVHIARTILTGWTAWNLGPIHRFVY